MRSDEILAIVEGQFRGWLLRSGGGRGAQTRMDQAGSRWRPAPLRLLARAYPADSEVWTWLGGRGVRRPSPSGPSGPSIPRASRTRRALEVTLSDEAHKRLDRAVRDAEKWRCGNDSGKPTKSGIIECLILGLDNHGCRR